MTRHIDYRQGAVIELGPGTGVFTRALVAAGLSPRQLALVEANPEFAAALSPRHPGARVICTGAAALIDALPLFGHALAGTVISGLPLRSMPSEQVTLIVRGVFKHQLRSDGAFFLFTYGVRCPIPRALIKQLDLDVVRVGRVIFNLPAATVYCIRRRKRAQLSV